MNPEFMRKLQELVDEFGIEHIDRLCYNSPASIKRLEELNNNNSLNDVYGYIGRDELNEAGCYEVVHFDSGKDGSLIGGIRYPVRGFWFSSVGDQC